MRERKKVSGLIPGNSCHYAACTEHFSNKDKTMNQLLLDITFRNNDSNAVSIVFSLSDCKITMLKNFEAWSVEENQCTFLLLPKCLEELIMLLFFVTYYSNTSMSTCLMSCGSGLAKCVHTLSSLSSSREKTPTFPSHLWPPSGMEIREFSFSVFFSRISGLKI